MGGCADHLQDESNESLPPQHWRPLRQMPINLWDALFADSGKRFDYVLFGGEADETIRMKLLEICAPTFTPFSVCPLASTTNLASRPT